MHSFTSTLKTILLNTVSFKLLARFTDVQTSLQVISGVHRALLWSITFIIRLNALNYTKLRG